MTDLIVRGERVVLPDGVTAATVHVRGGRIAHIGALDERVGGVPVIDAGSLVVMPGLVDTHVHINDPGRADWEGFAHATRAAAAGGVTTLVDMPLNSIPPTTTVEGLKAKRAAAAETCHVDVGFWGGVVPGNRADLEPLVRAGVLGFKCFLSPSGVDEFDNVTENDLQEAMPIVSRLSVPLLAHAEWPALLREPVATADPRRYHTWLESRPTQSEHAAIDLLIRVSRDHGTHIHIVHLASADALPALAAARRAGLPLTVETCPHYLTFAAEDIADGATAFKCAPPIRSRSHRERLWTALVDGEIDLIATDHSPAPAALKCFDSGDFIRAWGGVASLQIALPVVWTGASARGISIDRVARWMSAGPARLANLGHRKGGIAVDRDADFVVFDPDDEITVDAKTLYHLHPITPYDGARLRGRVHKTILRGQTIFDEGVCGPAALGQMLAAHGGSGGEHRGRRGAPRASRDD
jgi:allantoinase